MADKCYPSLIRPLFWVLFLLTLSGCGPMIQEKRPRFFWPPPPAEPKIEYIDYYFTDADLQRGVDWRLEDAILALQGVGGGSIQLGTAQGGSGAGRFMPGAAAPGDRQHVGEGGLRGQAR